MPLYNKRDYVADSLASVVRQSFRDFEIIVVDDGSTDDSASVVREMKLPNLKLVTQENAGVSAARNRCLAEASSEFVAFLDSDDIWQKDHLKHLWQLHLTCPDAHLLANSFLEVRNAVGLEVSSVATTYRRVSDFIAEAAEGRSWIFTSAAMVHRASCLSVGGFRVGESRGEDIDLWIRMGSRLPVAVSDYLGCLYRRVDNSLTTSLSVLDPDVAMRGISETLLCDRDLDAGRRRSLEELYNRIAIAHATDCLARGERKAAQKFLALASNTQVWARRWQLARLLSLLPPSMVAGLGGVRSWMRNAMESRT